MSARELRVASSESRAGREVRDCSGRRTERGLQVWLAIFFCLLYLLTASGRLVNRDAEAVFQVARSLVEHGSFAVPAASVFIESVGPRGTGGDSLSFAAATARVGLDGRPYSMYGLGQSLAAVPLYAAGKLLQPLVQVSTPIFTRLSASLLNSLVTALTVLLLYRLSRTLGQSVRGALLVAFAYGLGSMAWPYAKSFASEPLTGALLLLGFYAVERAIGSSGRSGGRWLALSGAAYGGAVLVRVSASIALPIALLYLLWRAASTDRQTDSNKLRSRLLWRLALWSGPVAAALVGVGLYNFARFGDALTTGYQSIAWNVSPQTGLYGLLLSPGKGLFWYNPLLIVGAIGLAVMLWRRRPPAFYVVGLAVVWIGFHSPYRFWEGGWSWGPRLLLPIVPLLILPLGELLCENKSALTLALSQGEREQRGGDTLALSRGQREERGVGTLFVLVFGVLGRRVTTLLLVIGVLVQIGAVGADYTRYLWANYLEHPDDAYRRVVYDPTGSPLLWQPIALLEVTANAVRPGSLEGLRRDMSDRARRHGEAGLDEDALGAAVQEDTMVVGLNVPDFWFILLVVFGAPAEPVMAVAICLALLLAVAAVGLARQVRAAEEPGPSAERVLA